jgi:hypothetical protein
VLGAGGWRVSRRLETRRSETRFVHGFVHGFVHETLRDGLRWGRCQRQETHRIGEDMRRPVGRGQRHHQRLPETAETAVVWLITQRRTICGCGGSSLAQVRGGKPPTMLTSIAHAVSSTELAINFPFIWTSFRLDRRLTSGLELLGPDLRAFATTSDKTIRTRTLIGVEPILPTPSLNQRQTHLRQR